jgi:hypothetical protein
LKRHPWLIAITIGAAAVWLATAALIVSSSWFLQCTVDGQPLGGIDCFQADSIPQTDSEPARSIGFVPLAATWLAATLGLSLLITLSVRARRRERAEEG